MFVVTNAETETTVNSSTYKCSENENFTAAEFRDCFEKAIKPLSPVLGVNFKTYEHKVEFNPFNVFTILIPSEGSVTFEPSLNPTVLLEPLFKYFVILFDKNYMFPFFNPMISKRTFLPPLQQNLTMFVVQLKVSTSSFNYLYSNIIYIILT